MRKPQRTSDIKITVDSGGWYDAKHKYAGTLIDGSIFNNRSECRREAVKVLLELKEVSNSRTA